MALNTLDNLITPEDEDGVLTALLTSLASVGFPTTAWQTGGVIYALLRVFSKALADLLQTVEAITRGGLLDLATGAWLTLLAKSAYDLDRFLATFAQGTVTVFNGGGSPQTIQPAQLWITDASGHRYNSINAAPVVIAAGGSAVITFKAESPGAGYNVATGTAMSLVTPLPGVTVTPVAVSGGTWLTVQGTDDEADADLRTRCRTRWATIGIEKTADAYRHLAMNTPGVATPVTRVYVDDQNPRGPGTLNLWIAGPAGPVSTADETLVRAYVLARKAPCTDVQVANATPLAVDISAVVTFFQQYTSAVSQITDNLTALINAAPLGGVIRLAEVIEQIMSPQGVYDESALTLNGAALNLALAPNQVAVPGVFTLTQVATP